MGRYVYDVNHFKNGQRSFTPTILNLFSSLYQALLYTPLLRRRHFFHQPNTLSTTSIITPYRLFHAQPPKPVNRQPPTLRPEGSQGDFVLYPISTLPISASPYRGPLRRPPPSNPSTSFQTNTRRNRNNHNNRKGQKQSR